MTLRILHVIATLDRGGTEVTAVEIARCFHLWGSENYFMALEEGKQSILPELSKYTESVTVLQSGRIPRAFHFYKSLKDINPSAILFHIFNAELPILSLAARFFGHIPMAAKLGNPVAALPGMAWKTRLIYQASLFNRVQLVAASHWIKSSLAEVGLDTTPVRVIHNGCAVDEIKRRACLARRRVDNSFTFGMISRLDPIKDHVTLLKAFSKIPPEIAGRTTKLLIVGDGSTLTMLEELSSQLHLGGRVDFCGALNNVPETLALFDVFVFSTTREEGFGVVLIEALAAGIPIIASDVPACREVLKDGKLGELVPPNDSDTLAASMIRALTAELKPPSNIEIHSIYDSNRLARQHLEALTLAL